MLKIKKIGAMFQVFGLEPMLRAVGCLHPERVLHGKKYRRALVAYLNLWAMLEFALPADDHIDQQLDKETTIFIAQSAAVQPAAQYVLVSHFLVRADFFRSTIADSRHP